MSFTMSFNNIVLPIRIFKVEGRGPLSQEVYLQSKPFSPGSYFRKRRITERLLAVHYSFSSNGLEDNRRFIDNLNAILYVPTPVPIVFLDEPEKTYYGIPSGKQDWEETLIKSKGVLNIICPDPYKYGAEKILTVGVDEIVNEGSAETSPIIIATFNATATDFVITNQEGYFVKVIRNFIAGDVLEIDLVKRKVLINGKLSMPSYYWRNKPFKILPGENTLNFEPADVTDIKVKFRPAWK